MVQLKKKHGKVVCCWFRAWLEFSKNHNLSFKQIDPPGASPVSSFLGCTFRSTRPLPDEIYESKMSFSESIPKNATNNKK